MGIISTGNDTTGKERIALDATEMREVMDKCRAAIDALCEAACELLTQLYDVIEPYITTTVNGHCNKPLRRAAKRTPVKGIAKPGDNPGQQTARLTTAHTRRYTCATGG